MSQDHVPAWEELKLKNWTCPNCGGTKVQQKAWIELNTEKLVDFIDINDEEDYWCPDCKQRHIPELK